MDETDSGPSSRAKSEAFLSELFQFQSRNGTPIKRIPMLGGRELDLYQLYKKVKSLGGSKSVQENRLWGEVARSFKLPSSVTSASYAVRQHYIKLLERFELYKADPISYELNSTLASPMTNISSPWRPFFNVYTPTTQDGGGTPVVIPLSTLMAHVQDSTGMDSVNINKLVRSLLSGFPNEIDFAFNILTVLSFESGEIVSIHKLPHLLAALLAHVAVFSADDPGLEDMYHECWHKNSASDYQQFWELTVPEWIFVPVLGIPFSKASYCSSLFNHHIFPSEESIESFRVSQVASIIRNLSFHDQSAQCFAGNTAVLRFLILSINNRLPSIKSLSLDTLVNIAPYIILPSLTTPTHSMTTPFGSTTDLLLGAIYDCILCQDKLSITRGLETLGELSWSPANITCLVSTSTEIYRCMFQLLLLEDCELLLTCLDTLYSLSSSCIEITRTILTVETSCSVLVNLLTVKMEEFGSEQLSHVKLVEKGDPERQQQQQQAGQLTTSLTRTPSNLKGHQSNINNALSASLSHSQLLKHGRDVSLRSSLSQQGVGSIPDITKGTPTVKVGNKVVHSVQGNQRVNILPDQHIYSSPLSRALTNLKGQNVIPILTIQQLQELLVKSVPGMPKVSGSQSISTPSAGTGGQVTTTVVGSNVRVDVLKGVDRGQHMTLAINNATGQSSDTPNKSVKSLQPQSDSFSSRSSTPDSFSSVGSSPVIIRSSPQQTPIRTSLSTSGSVSTTTLHKSLSAATSSVSVTSSTHSHSHSGQIIFSTSAPPDPDKFTRQWLSACYQEASGCYVSPIEMYSLYVMACAEKGMTKVMTLNDFNNCVRKVFPSSLSTKITVAGTVVFMVAGLAKKTTPTAQGTRDTVVTFVPPRLSVTSQSVKEESGNGNNSPNGSKNGLTNVINESTGQSLSSIPPKIVSVPSDVCVASKSIGVQATSKTLHSGSTAQLTVKSSTLQATSQPVAPLTIQSSTLKTALQSASPLTVQISTTQSALQSVPPLTVQSSTIQTVLRTSSPLTVSIKAPITTPIGSEIKPTPLGSVFSSTLPPKVKDQTVILPAGVKGQAMTLQTEVNGQDIPPVSVYAGIPSAKRIKIDNCLMSGETHIDRAEPIMVLDKQTVSNGPVISCQQVSLQNGCSKRLFASSGTNNTRDAVSTNNASLTSLGATTSTVNSLGTTTSTVNSLGATTSTVNSLGIPATAQSIVHISTGQPITDSRPPVTPPASLHTCLPRLGTLDTHPVNISTPKSSNSTAVNSECVTNHNVLTPGPEGRLCCWSNCTSEHSNWNSLLHHVVCSHLQQPSPAPCQWRGCSSRVKRMRPSMMRHVQVHHCCSGAPPPPPNIPLTLAKIRHNPPLAHEPENSLTKAVHLTAALILRNLARILPEAKRRLLPYESRLCQVAMSTSEANTAIAHCLDYINNYQLP